MDAKFGGIFAKTWFNEIFANTSRQLPRVDLDPVMVKNKITANLVIFLLSDQLPLTQTRVISLANKMNANLQSKRGRQKAL